MCVEKEGKRVFSEIIQDFWGVLGSGLCSPCAIPALTIPIPSWGESSGFHPNSGLFWGITGSARPCAAPPKWGTLMRGMKGTNGFVNEFLCRALQIPGVYSWDLLTNGPEWCQGTGQGKGVILTLKFILVAMTCCWKWAEEKWIHKFLHGMAWIAKDFRDHPGKGRDSSHQTRALKTPT